MKKKITVCVGPYDITLDGGAIILDWDGDGEIVPGGMLVGKLPRKITADELAAFREWLSKCPFDPDTYNRD